MGGLEVGMLRHYIHGDMSRAFHPVDRRLMLLQGVVVQSHTWWYCAGDTGEAAMIV
jgi:hypothetical protein